MRRASQILRRGGQSPAAPPGEEVTMSTQSKQVLAARATTMRLEPTTSEALLWEHLRGSRLGVGFRRQFVIGNRIADFCAPSIKLVVEVDGGYHAERGGADARRERELERLGYRVVRVEAELVVRDVEAAVAVVRGAVEGPR
jgi:very-short-patch-repair endonuclease